MSSVKILFVCWCIFNVPRRTEGSITLGTCSLSCNVGESQAHEYLGQAPGLVGPPGKSGPMGPRGLPGPTGQRGVPGANCDCSRYDGLDGTNRQLKATVEAMEGQLYMQDCAEAKATISTSGTLVIFPLGRTKGFHAYCDQDTDGGGWIVFQRRIDGSEEFFREWEDYVRGFGQRDREMWIGLEIIHAITSNASYELRVDLEDFYGNKAFAKYSTFRVAGPDDNYRLTVSGYSGTAGDGLAHHDNAQFSTAQRDHDEHETYNCAAGHKGGWWYKQCHTANLNGEYYDTVRESTVGISWRQWKGKYEVLKRVEMKMRRKM